MNERAAAYARKRAAELVGKKWVNGKLVDNPNADMAITDTTRDRLKAMVADAFENGMSPDDLRKQVMESFEFSSERAELIADTELASAQSGAAMEEWQESGVVEKKGWLISGDHSEPDECDDAEAAGEIDIDEEFPGGVTEPPLHPGCQCDIYGVIS